MEEILNTFNDYLNAVYANEDTPAPLRESMEYSLFSQGKRIRPLLCFAIANLKGKQYIERVFPLAAAIEMVHTYSLIHDDLPAMDDDDIRRGKASNHKAYNEATAILAGDGLLSQSFNVLQDLDVSGEKMKKINKLFSRTIGVSGMVAGQIEDIALENQNHITVDMLEQVQINKTGRLFECAVMGSAEIIGVNAQERSLLQKFWLLFGKLFQSVDDYLDDDPSTGKTVGIDAKNNKTTMLSLLGKTTLKKNMIEELTILTNLIVELQENANDVTYLAEILRMIGKKIV